MRTCNGEVMQVGGVTLVLFAPEIETEVVGMQVLPVSEGL
jgi:hypothetical protein